jgi:hypothetical protein
MTLQQKLSELDLTLNRHKRGSLFEELVAGVLEEQGFDVTLNAQGRHSSANRPLCSP